MPVKSILCAVALAGMSLGSFAVGAQAKPGSLMGVWMGEGLNPTYADPIPLHRTQPPLRPEYQQAYDEKLKAQRDATAAGKPLHQEDDTCTPYGMPTMMQAGHPIEFIETPGRITIIGEVFTEIRRVYLGKEQTSPEDTEPTFEGHSVGRWEGDTLVIDTVGVKDYVLMRQAPHSNQMRIVERITMVSEDQIRNDVTVTDPVYLTKPWVFGWRYNRLTDYELSEYICEDNREYQDETGAIRFRFAE